MSIASARKRSTTCDHNDVSTRRHELLVVRPTSLPAERTLSGRRGIIDIVTGTVGNFNGNSRRRHPIAQRFRAVGDLGDKRNVDRRFQDAGIDVVAYVNSGSATSRRWPERHAVPELGDGQIASWQVVTRPRCAPQLLGSAPSNFQIVAVADFTGDHQADILFRNVNTGEIAEWQVSNNQLGPAAPPHRRSTSTTNHVVGTGVLGQRRQRYSCSEMTADSFVVWLLNSAATFLGSAGDRLPRRSELARRRTGDLSTVTAAATSSSATRRHLIEWLMNGSSIQTAQAIGAPVAGFHRPAHTSISSDAARGEPTDREGIDTVLLSRLGFISR